MYRNRKNNQMDMQNNLQTEKLRMEKKLRNSTINDPLVITEEPQGEILRMRNTTVADEDLLHDVSQPLNQYLTPINGVLVLPKATIYKAENFESAVESSLTMDEIPASVKIRSALQMR